MQPGDARWAGLRERVRGLYERPIRAYHDWSHIEACLRELQAVRHLCTDPVAVELAIWFHDCVYEPRRHDNEEQSARIAKEWLSAAGLERAPIDEVRRLILVTRHNAIPDWADGGLMVDIDLAILGQAAAVFDAYERAIREEYAFVPEQAFREGRRKVLQAFLERNTIYTTESFRERYEQVARRNLERSVQGLGG